MQEKIREFLKDIENFESRNYSNLMKKRVRKILLISTYYDAYIFEEDGKLSEQITGEYNALNLSSVPTIKHVYTGEEALNELQNDKYDLIISLLRIGKITPFELSKQIKEIYPELPVVLLLNVLSDVSVIDNKKKQMEYIDEVFIWNGDSKIFLAIVKLIEDRWNLEDDTKNGLIRIIILVEDSIHYYSIFLPVLYSEIMMHVQQLITGELNDHQKLLRMRARPKVVLTHSYEETMQVFRKYKKYVWSVISDVKYNMNGSPDSEAGIKLIRNIKEELPYLPALLQSSEIANKVKAENINIAFLHKYSKDLIKQLRDFIKYSLGFGDFYFNTEEYQLKASNWLELEEAIRVLPLSVILYHAERNHFSIWFSARGEMKIAMKLRYKNIKDFPQSEDIRTFLIEIIKFIRHRRNRGNIIDYNELNLDLDDEVVRLSGGSFGGKGRGLAFLNHFLIKNNIDKRFPETIIRIPKTAIICTNEFDYFIDHNNIKPDIIEKENDEIKRIFLEGELSEGLLTRLETYIKVVQTPVAVRSSSLLEDSQFQPFAGVYQTYMLPNNHQVERVRFEQLCMAIKLVFSSKFLKNAQRYIEGLSYKFEEEKMAVILQQVVGTRHESLYYPHFSGVAQSYNYYATKDFNHESGIVSLAFGLGMTVVEGERGFLFSPAEPKRSFISDEHLAKTSQNHFYAINMENSQYDLMRGESATLIRNDVSEAISHGTLDHIASTFDYHSQRLFPGITNVGPKVISFADILKYEYFPLAEILRLLLREGQRAMGTPIEIEFAVDLADKRDNNKSVFYLLQIRPLALNEEEHFNANVSIENDRLLLLSNQGMGNGKWEDIYDIVFVTQDKYNNLYTEEMAAEIEIINEQMKKENRRYILIGPGRWGTRDRFLGVPVKWEHINHAKVIVETDTESHFVEASYGSHFFHNLVSMNIGYLSVMKADKNNFIDWKWLISQKALYSKKYFTVIRTDNPNTVIIDGRKSITVIYKGNAN